MPPEYEGRETFKCEVEECGYIFLTKKRHKEHTDQIHGDAPRKKYKTPKQPEFGPNTLSTKKSFKIKGSIQCPHCYRPMSSDQKLQSHIQRMHGEKSFFCQDCNRGFCREKQLKLHLENQKFSCKDGSRIKGAGIMGQHMRKHKGESDEFKVRTNPKKQKTNPHTRGKVAPGREIETQAAVDSINMYQWGKNILYQ